MCFEFPGNQETGTDTVPVHMRSCIMLSLTARCVLSHHRRIVNSCSSRPIGVFGGHLRDVKVHSELRHYWWPGMRGDVSQWSRGCLVCATHNTGRAVRPPLTPIPVAGPLDSIGVNFLDLWMVISTLLCSWTISLNGQRFPRCPRSDCSNHCQVTSGGSRQSTWSASRSTIE